MPKRKSKIKDPKKPTNPANLSQDNSDRRHISVGYDKRGGQNSK